MMVVSEDEEGEEEEDEEEGEGRVLTARWLQAKLEEKGKPQVLHRSLWKDVGGRNTMDKVYRDFVPRLIQGAAQSEWVGEGREGRRRGREGESVLGALMVALEGCGWTQDYRYGV